MIVTFVSQCEKKALNRTRRVLDAFADRIGSNTWQTVITQEGLLAVKKLLRKTATKNTAVSCHWIRSRRRSELVWVVGNRDKFDYRGVVPVNSTKVNRVIDDTKQDWQYLGLIQSLACVAALLHDWGKANAQFQAKLVDSNTPQSDAIRHEWVSCVLLKAFILIEPATWLVRLKKGEINERALQRAPLEALASQRIFQDLDPTAQLLMWLIVTHHKLPAPVNFEQAKNSDAASSSLTSTLNTIAADWGYKNADNIQACLIFHEGLLSKSSQWLKPLKRWADKLIHLESDIKALVTSGAYKVVLHHARLSLMLGDHKFSSLSKADSGAWQPCDHLLANTDENCEPKQYLGQHLLGVYKTARDFVNLLPAIEASLPKTDNTRQLRKKSPKAFAWQDKAVEQITAWREQQGSACQGFFAVNMASTGCGKTFANAKVMRALADDGDSLRFNLALGLRSLTLQTGDEYRERIFQSQADTDLAVLIGSKAVSTLHGGAKQQQEEHGYGSESAESLLADFDDVIGECDIPQDSLSTVLTSRKHQQLLYAPVLVSTIDHLIQATEVRRGGRYILPSLRLMSADLVIDEIDDFTGDDLIAIGRLIYIAGLLGRRVMISSATIPPSMANGYFHAYAEGWRLFSETRAAAKPQLGCAWIDEFNTSVETMTCSGTAPYENAHQQFIAKRIAKLAQQPAYRKARIISCDDLLAVQQRVSQSELFTEWVARIQQSAIQLHHLHHSVDPETGLAVSFGVIRVANIGSCIALTRHVLARADEQDCRLVVMAYHSQQVLLQRHVQEQHLDEVLKRKEGQGEVAKAFRNSEIRRHIKRAKRDEIPQISFVVVATPVEEVGRDHDFDWAVIEPSSFRSIVQMAGRVQRHRKQLIETPNIGILQYNWKALRQGANSTNENRKGYFTKPGFESKCIRLGKSKTPALCSSYDMNELIDVGILTKKLDATARVQGPIKGFKLANLEHAVTGYLLSTNVALKPSTLLGYTHGHWQLTALPQLLKRFRAGGKNLSLFRYIDEADDILFVAKDEKGFVMRDSLGGVQDKSTATLKHRRDTYVYSIKQQQLSDTEHQNLWLPRQYQQSLLDEAERHGLSEHRAALLFGELSLPFYQKDGNGIYEQAFIYIEALGLFSNTGGLNDASSD